MLTVQPGTCHTVEEKRREGGSLSRFFLCRREEAATRRLA